jgi:ATP/maltotriose-dependent transcriptional regulator MalT/DNA-binding SARP family transcriptional activator
VLQLGAGTVRISVKKPIGSKNARLAKFTRPRLHSPVERHRLFDVLDASREWHKAVMVVGPPGAGKSTLVASWMAAREIPGIWFQVDAGDAEAATFFHYLARAAEPFLPRSAPPLPALTPEYAADVLGFARRFFRDLFALLPVPSLVVLDNYQEAGAGDTFQSLVVEAIEQLPEQVLLVPISRTKPSPHYARLIAREELALVEWDALRLTLDETRAIVSARGAVEERVTRALHEQSDGWAAGVTLMLDRMRRSGNLSRLQQPASLETVFDYFASLLLNQLAPDLCDALVKCSVLQNLDADLAATLTGVPEAGRLLEELYHRHLFVDRRQEARASYEFHALFRRFLLHRLEQQMGAAAIKALRQRAGTLLEPEGRVDEACALFTAAEDWSSLTRLLTAEAPRLLAQGRSTTLASWIRSMPQAWIEERPWLLYWQGQALIGDDLDGSRKAFERANEGFQAQGSAAGQIVAIAGVMETHYFFWSRFPAIDVWIDRTCDLMQAHPVFPNAELELHAYATLLMAMQHRTPRSSWLPRVVERIQTLLQADLSEDRKVRAGCMLMGYAHAASNLALALWTVATIDPIAARPGVSALARCMWSGRMGLHLAHKGDYEAAIAAIDRAEAIAESHGIVHDRALRWFWGVLATLGAANLARAEAFVRKLEEVARPDRPLERGMAHYCRCMLALAQGDPATGVENGRGAVRMVEGEAVFWPQAHFTGYAAWAMAEAGQLEEAHAYVEKVRELVSGSFLAAYEADMELCMAAIAMKQGQLSRCHAHVARACELGRERNYLFMQRAMTPILSKVLGEALRAGVEADYLRGIIRRFGLWPAPPGNEAWPWPLRVRVLGRFELLVDDTPPAYSRKLPRKALALLCVVVALGGRNVPEADVLDALWPDEEADLAYRSLTATVRRLRDLVERKSVIHHASGTLTIDARSTWIDTWAFEHAADGDAPPDWLRAVGLYRGAFLPGESAAWAISIRERLRSRFVQCVLKLGECAEREGSFEDAIAHYDHGLTVEDGVEALYQGLMRCYGRLRRPSEAADTYRRLQEVLRVTRNAQPSAESSLLHEQCKGGRLAGIPVSR